jgi:hypothetical protein
MIISRSVLLITRNISDKVAEKIKTHILHSVTYPPPPPQTVLFMKKCGKIWYRQTGHRWQCNRAHAHCMQDNWGYRRALSIYNNCFSKVTTVARTRLTVTLYVQCLYCLILMFPKVYVTWNGNRKEHIGQNVNYVIINMRRDRKEERKTLVDLNLCHAFMWAYS